MAASTSWIEGLRRAGLTPEQLERAGVGLPVQAPAPKIVAPPCPATPQVSEWPATPQPEPPPGKLTSAIWRCLAASASPWTC